MGIQSRIIIAAGTMLIMGMAYAQDATRVLDLEKSIASGLLNNQRLLSLQERVDLAKQRYNEAQSLVYPKIDFNFSISQFNNDFPTVLAPSFNSIYLPAYNKEQYYSTRFTLWQYLYAGGRYTTNLRVAETNISHTISLYEVEKNKIIRDVKIAFYSCLVYEEKMKVYKSALGEIEDRISGEKKDKSTLKQYRENMQLELLRLEHEYSMARLNFLSVLGLELNTEIQITGKLDQPNDVFELSKCLAWGYEFRPELQQTQFQETIDSLRVNLSLTERYPTITLGANYEWVGDQFPLPEKNWNASINLNVPIFDGWASWSRIKQRKLQVREGKIRRAEIEDTIQLEIRHAFLDYNYWHQRMLSIDNPEHTDGTYKEQVEAKILRLECLEQLLASHARLEWAIARTLNNLKQ